MFMLIAHDYLKAIVRPRPELHDARLLVKREILDVYLARGLIDGRWLPFHATSVVERRLRCQSDFKITISTEDKITN
jgi:hypothetical protein